MLFLEIINMIGIPSYLIFIQNQDTFVNFISAQINHMVITFGIQYPLLQIFDYKFLRIFINRWKLSRYQQEDCPYTQFAANKIFEPKKFSLWKGYQYVIMCLVLQLWYHYYLSSTGVFFLPLILAGHYWIEKIFMIVICQTPPTMEENLILFIF
eukprot:TRINITY_DN6855_c0_g3_i1.p1 TRINITY_DN6855_c0_g3~~TRINITY_DN6855_c0_g3_i1.p1  ORF type:complete len:154 (+),score=4.23 TRINITY_DN6855_c0_g3_i1:1-462(+)